jgi:hypothetical protein
MKIKPSLSTPFYSTIKSLLKFKGEFELPPENPQTRGEGLARLHEYQHQVIVGLFRINIAGLVAFLLIVLSFTLFTMSDPYAPKWIGIMMISVGSLLLVGCYRTVREFLFYRKNYRELMTQLQKKLREYLVRPQEAQKRPSGRARESRVLAVLKPREHEGWDYKPCRNCQKAIELLASVCQHCGQEQEDTLQN